MRENRPIEINVYKAWLEQQPQEALDEFVYDAKGNEAADLNNEGRETQIAYLIGPKKEEQNG